MAGRQFETQGFLQNFAATAFFRGVARALILLHIYWGITVQAMAQTVGDGSTPSQIIVPYLGDLNQPLSIGNYQQTAITRVTRTVFDFTYTASLNNSSSNSYYNVKATLKSRNSATVVTDGNLSFNSAISPFQMVASQDSFTIRQDRTVPFNPADLEWAIQTNQVPLANAGPDTTVLLGSEVELNGTASTDADGNPITYRWSLIERPTGSNAGLDNAQSAKPRFTADRAGRYIWQLIVNDGYQDSVADSVIISTENTKPIANAGPDQTVATGDIVYLNGNHSYDPDGDELQFIWALSEKPDTSNTQLSLADTANPFFTADKLGSYVIHLTVNDGQYDSEADLVIVSTKNSAPVADAGSDLSFTLGDPVLKLNGTGSHDVDGQPLSYHWAILNAPPENLAAITPDNIAEPSFEPLLEGLYTLQLIVNDGELDSLPDTVNIDAKPQPNRKPNIISAPITIAGVGKPYSYDVDAEDPDKGDTLTFSLTGAPAGMNIDSSSGLIQWTPTAEGNFNVGVKVQDKAGLSDGQNYVITVVANHAPQITSEPVTNATADTVYTYQASAIDPDGDQLTFSLTDAPSGMSIDNTGLIQWLPSNDQTGSQRVSVLVRDTGTLTDEQNFDILVSSPNRSPIAADDQFETTLDVPLNVAAPGILINDSDPDGTQLSAIFGMPPANGSVLLNSDGSFNYTPNSGFVGADSFTYKVSDGLLESSLATVTITVSKANLAPVINSIPQVSEWKQITPIGTPPTPRFGSGWSPYDEVNDRLILFGGDVYVPNHQHPADIWVLKNATGIYGDPEWVQLSPINSGPAGRLDHSAIYDPTSNRLIVHAGCSDHCNPLSDTWVLTHANGLGGDPEWIQLPSYSPRTDHAAGYDAVSNRMVIYGGYATSNDNKNDVAVLIDANGIGEPKWVALSPTGTRPPARGNNSSAIYDPLSNTLIAFGGSTWQNVPQNDVWILTHANGLGGQPEWRQLSPSGLPPSPRAFSQLAYDPNSNELIAYGGWDTSNDSQDPSHWFNDSWILTHANGQGGQPEWIRLDRNAMTKPNARAAAQTGYNHASNRLVVAMGRNDAEGNSSTTATFNDVWLLTNASGNCTAGQACDYDVDASDPDAGDSLTYELVSGPEGMSIDAASGQLHWIPTAEQVGDHAVGVRVKDSGGLTETQNFTLTVSSVAVPNVQGLAPEWAESLLAAAGLSTGSKISIGGAISLNFDTLPSEQGWEYAWGPAGAPSESSAFSIGNNGLKMDTFGIGSRAAFYKIATGIDVRLPLDVSVRARVSDEELGTSSNHYGFSFFAWPAQEIFGVGLGKQLIEVEQKARPVVIDFDTSAFHEYLLEATPGSGLGVSVDNQIINHGEPYVYPYPNSYALVFGDGTEGPNTKAEIASYTFTQPQIQTQTPAPGTLVKPNSAVNLSIQDGPATQIVPPVEGLTVAMAEAELIAAGLQLGTVTEKADNTVSAGSVIKQKTVAGTHIMKDFKVNIIATPSNGNHKPVITSTPITVANSTEPYLYDVDAVDADAGDYLTYSLTTAPAGMVIDTITGLIEWTPDTSQSGSQAVTVEVQDSGGLTATQTFTIEVTYVSHAPSAVADHYVTQQDVAINQAADGVLSNDFDLDGDLISAILVTDPANGTVNLHADGSFTYTPNAGFVGADSFTYKVSDGQFESVPANVTITVTELVVNNLPPAITSTPNTSHWLQLSPTGKLPDPKYAGSVQSYDEANDRLIVFGGQDASNKQLNDVWVLSHASGLGGTPEWKKLQPTGTTPSPRAHFISAYDATANRLIVYGGFCGGDCSPLADAWVLTHANGLGGEPEWLPLPASSNLAYGVGGYDLVNNRLIVYGGLSGTDLNTVKVLVDANSVGEPKWTTLNPEGTPPPPRGHSQPGVYDSQSNTLIVFGGQSLVGSSANYNDVWLLNHANGLGGTPAWTQLTPSGSAPIPRAHHTLAYDANSNHLIVFGGYDGDTNSRLNDSWVLTHANGQGGKPEWIKLTITELPKVASTPTAGYSGLSNRLITAFGVSMDETVLNDTWVLTNASGNCTAGQPCDYDVDASDPDVGDSLTYELVSGPEGMSIDAASGQLHWIPTSEQVGDHAVNVRVKDAGGLTAAQNFTLTVSPVAVPNVRGLAPEWAESLLAAAGLSTGTKTSIGGAISLNFDTLPSEQGWIYAGGYLGTPYEGPQGWTYRVASSAVPENQIFSVSNGMLYQNSIGAGFANEVGHRYDFPGVADKRLPFEITLRSRVLQEEGAFTTNSAGYAFGLASPPDQLFLIGLGTSRIEDQFTSTLAQGIDNTQFHDYLLVGTPGGESTFTRDGQMIAEGHSRTYPFASPTNYIQLGDTTAGTNAKAETAAYSFKQPQIATQTPPPGTLVKPASAVDLSIQDGPATQTVPPVEGLNVGQAEADLLAAGLQLGTVTEQTDNTVSAGTVLKQKTVAGTHIMKDFKVDLIAAPSNGNHKPVITSTPITVANSTEPYLYDVNAVDADAGDYLTYSFTTAPTGMTIDTVTGLIEWIPLPSQVGNQDVTVEVQDNGGLKATQSFSIVVSATNRAPTIPSTPPASVKANKLYSYQVTASDPDAGDKLTYGFATGTPPGMTIDVDTGLLQWTPPETFVGVHHGIGIKVTDKGGLSATQTFDLTVLPANRAPVISSVAPAVATENVAYSYAVQASDPDAGDTLTYNLVNGPAGMAMDANGVISWLPSSAQLGEHPVAIEVKDQDGLATSQDYSLKVEAATVSVPSVIGQTVAAAQAALTAAQLNLGGQTGAYDEVVPVNLIISQQPAAGVAVAKNSAVDVVISLGPAPVSVPSVLGMTEAAAESVIVAAKLTLGSKTSQYHETLAAGLVVGQSPPPGSSVSKNSAVDLLISLGPAPVNVPGVVGMTQAAAEAAIAAANLALGAITTQASELVPAGAVISQAPPVGATVAKGSAVDLLVSSGPVPQPLSAIIIQPESPLLLTGEGLTLSALGILGDGTSQTLTGASWSSSVPAVATVDASGNIVAQAEGQTVISVQQGSISATITVTVKAAASDDVTPPDAAITAPVLDATITTPTDIVGTASDANFLKYELSLSPVGENNFSVFHTGTSAVNAGVLGVLDPTLLLNDQYVLRLTVWDRYNNTASTDVRVQIAREQKVGNFTLAFQDVNIPMACMPISVTRVYDSRDKRQGDFGVGWRLDVKTLQLRESREMGSGWHVDLVNKKVGFITLPYYVLSADDSHKVSLTLPDGQVEEFDMAVSPSESQLYPLGTVNVSYAPRPGTLGSLAPVGPTSWDLSGDTGSVELIDSDINPFDPQQYVYTTPDGSRYLIDKTGGVQNVSCANGQSLSFNQNGISHSDGAGVGFTRDAQGRITAITDPNGNSQSYSYNAAGDLVKHTDPVGNNTGFKYDYRHGLLEVIDPRGVQAVRNEYDAAGRLLGNTDAAGQKIVYHHDLVNKTETITDRLGNSTVYDYDAQGNVIHQVDALGHETAFTYDSVGNQLSKTDALGRTTTQEYDSRRNVLKETDPLGNVTRYTYHDLNGVKTITDALGRVTGNDYDADGNLLSTTDPLGAVTLYGYDKGGIVYPGSGLMTSKTDALGNVTRYNYDTQGRLSAETDAKGNVTTYAYDANGNRTQEQRTRTVLGVGVETLTTAFEYDALNRLVKTTHPDGSTSRTVYNAIGKQAQTLDAEGRITSYDYDDLGHLVKTTYPDGASETSNYDAEGRRIASTDRAGRITSYSYDALGRLVQTTYPDSTSSGTSYDAVGQVIASTDTEGHVTQYQYDAAGRRTKVIDALGHETVFAYDAAGNQTNITDANGNVTQFVYDNANRRTEVVYPDGSKDQTGYDALGRNISKTDQANITTQFGYDALGRLSKVTDALNQVTSYGYDELGNQLSQTDANGHTTLFAYDDMGRRVSRTLPEGQTETMTYDISGNLTGKTDFNGHTTTFEYDELNRLITKTPDAALSEPNIVFSYTGSGQRSSMQDASGTTSYQYDERDRLTEKATPQGTLTYSYNGAGLLAGIHSEQADGVNLSYGYDALNRLASVTDHNLGGSQTVYGYDNVGNLAAYQYANGVEHRYSYNSLNRLQNLQVGKGATDLAVYAYTLGPSGNRLSVAELGGRTVNYVYDALYRLTQETMAGSASHNGQIGYVYDPVGNRLNRTSTVAGIAPQVFSYNGNDQLASDQYDANGNTIGSDGQSYQYDSDNRLTDANGGAVKVVYDGDGNRVSKTAAGTTTTYLVDSLNPTGYAQVLEERTGGQVAVVYGYGLDLISQNRKSGSSWMASYYGYDGHGSVRFLTDAAGNVTDTYDYDAFGILLGKTGNTVNSYLYSGEQRDGSLDYYYLRARYVTSDLGRFLTLDPAQEDMYVPKSINRYSYAFNNPTTLFDPNGEWPIAIATSVTLGVFLAATYYWYKSSVVSEENESTYQLGSSQTQRASIFDRFNIPLRSPLKGISIITSNRGRRNLVGRVERHRGVDLVGERMDPVFATAAGRVVTSTGNSSRNPEARGTLAYGLHIKIQHSRGYETLYAHLASTNVVIGQQVRAGDEIGKVGNSGRTNPRPWNPRPWNPNEGYHLHYEVHHHDQLRDPLLFIPSNTVRDNN